VAKVTQQPLIGSDFTHNAAFYPLGETLEGMSSEEQSCWHQDSGNQDILQAVRRQALHL
jgi:hypothetical protein